MNFEDETGVLGILAGNFETEPTQIYLKNFFRHGILKAKIGKTILGA